MQQCPICGHKSTPFHATAGFTFFLCSFCEAICIDAHLVERIDGGEPLIEYNDAYWCSELPAAWARSYGPALARVAETILYTRRPIKRFLDIGSGPGYLLDALSYYLPTSNNVFHGIEQFPPPAKRCSTHPNFLVGRVADLTGNFDAGVLRRSYRALNAENVR